MQSKLRPVWNLLFRSLVCKVKWTILEKSSKDHWAWSLCESCSPKTYFRQPGWLAYFPGDNVNHDFSGAILEWWSKPTSHPAGPRLPWSATTSPTCQQGFNPLSGKETTKTLSATSRTGQMNERYKIVKSSIYKE